MRWRSESLARTSVKDEIVELELGHGAFLGFCGGTHVPLVERILGLAPVWSRQDVANRLGAAELVTGRGRVLMFTMRCGCLRWVELRWLLTGWF